MNKAMLNMAMMTIAAGLVVEVVVEIAVHVVACTQQVMVWCIPHQNSLLLVVVVAAVVGRGVVAAAFAVVGTVFVLVIQLVLVAWNESMNSTKLVADFA